MNIFCRVDDCRFMEKGFCLRLDISIDEDLKDYAPYCHCGAKMDGKPQKEGAK